uniref:Uncharacterized protein n=1 Tax=Anopheles christyi TaxID=43041 RepID=A0A182JSZ1_9DIPT
MAKVMCLLLMSAFLVALSVVGSGVSAAPQGQTGAGSSYSPIADIGRLASGATGLFGQTISKLPNF